MNSRCVGMREKWVTGVAKFPPGDPTVVSAAAVAAALASATTVEDESAPPSCPDEEYSPQALFDITTTSRALSIGPQKWWSTIVTRPVHIVHTDIEGAEFGPGHAKIVEKNRRQVRGDPARIMANSCTSPASSRTGGNVGRLASAHKTWRWLVASGLFDSGGRSWKRPVAR